MWVVCIFVDSYTERINTKNYVRVVCMCWFLSNCRGKKIHTPVIRYVWCVTVYVLIHTILCVKGGNEDWGRYINTSNYVWVVYNFWFTILLVGRGDPDALLYPWLPHHSHLSPQPKVNTHPHTCHSDFRWTRSPLTWKTNGSEYHESINTSPDLRLLPCSLVSTKLTSQNLFIL